MSARDRAFVNKHLADQKAIASYFASKGKAVPDWVTRQEGRFWNFQPPEDITTHLARFIRQALEQGKGGADLEALFLKLVALIDLMETLPLEDTPITSQAKSRANQFYYKLWRQSEDLDRKYKLKISLDLTKGYKPLEAWEKVIPKR